MVSKKSADAYRTISEVADMLGVKPHVLRFWEKKFTQIRPIKRDSGRRYYRPEDVRIIQQIKDLLYTHGYTVRGVQQLFKQKGVRVFQLRDASLEFETMMQENANHPSLSTDATLLTLPSDMRARIETVHRNIQACLERLGQ